MDNDLDIWSGDAPFIENGDFNFDVWSGDVPYLDGGLNQSQPIVRRRVSEF